MSSEEAASADEELVGVVEDIAVLARQLADKEPFKSATGPDALLALAAHLDEMATSIRAGDSPPSDVRVPVRRRRSR